MARSVRAEFVSGEMLKWARESAGLSLDQAAAAMRLDVERLAQWELQNLFPTMAQLRRIGELYRRPIAVFFLSEEPEAFQPLKDYRLRPGTLATESPALHRAQREAREQRELMKELLEGIGISPPIFSSRARLNSDPERTGNRLRQLLEPNLPAERRWGQPHRFLNDWRGAVEALGVLVFQSPDLGQTEVSGFSIAGPDLPTIVVDRSNTPRARVFTMMHELGHVMLRAGGICDLSTYHRLPPEKREVEVFCNHVAGAALIPLDDLLSTDIVELKSGQEWTSDELRILQCRFGASFESILRRLLILRKTTEAHYREWRSTFQREYADSHQATTKTKRKGGEKAEKKSLSTLGKPFIQVVLDAFHENRISAAAASDALGVRVAGFRELENLI